MDTPTPRIGFCARFSTEEGGTKFRRACADVAEFRFPGEWLPAVPGLRSATWVERGTTESVRKLTGALNYLSDVDYPWEGNTWDVIEEPAWTLDLRELLRMPQGNALVRGLFGISPDLAEDDVVYALRYRPTMDEFLDRLDRVIPGVKARVEALDPVGLSLLS